MDDKRIPGGYVPAYDSLRPTENAEAPARVEFRCGRCDVDGHTTFLGRIVLSDPATIDLPGPRRRHKAPTVNINADTGDVLNSPATAASAPDDRVVIVDQDDPRYDSGRQEICTRVPGHKITFSCQRCDADPAVRTARIEYAAHQVTDRGHRLMLIGPSGGLFFADGARIPNPNNPESGKRPRHPNVIG